jgi:hypothetical protein
VRVIERDLIGGHGGAVMAEAVATGVAMEAVVVAIDGRRYRVILALEPC